MPVQGEGLIGNAQAKHDEEDAGVAALEQQARSPASGNASEQVSTSSSSSNSSDSSQTRTP